MKSNGLTLSLFLLATAAFADPAGLDFSSALALAENNAPGLSAQNLRIEAARSAALSADALPDPKLSFGVENLPLSGEERWSLGRDGMTMQTIGLMQEVPNADKRRARAESATAAIAMAEAERRTERLKLRQEAARAWLTRYYLEKRLALFDEQEREIDLFGDIVRAQIAAGRAPAAEAVMPKQEAAELADMRDELNSALSKAKAELRRLLGPAADRPLAGDAPVWQPSELYHRHISRHPELERFEPAARMAAAELHEAQAMKKPDWGVELMYQRRGQAYSDMVSLQFSLDLPLFARDRQDPQIAAKRLETERVAAEREALLRHHVAELEQDLAEYRALERQIVRVRQDWIPLARQKLDLTLAGYRAGSAPLTEVLSARRELIRQGLKQTELEQRAQQLAAKLYFNFGEDAR